jgi:urease alpha subunit
MTALKAMTIWPAWQHFEENLKGSIEPGKIADFVLLSGNPAAVDPETLAALKVLVTIKEDRVIYEAEVGADSGDLTHAPLVPDPVAAHGALHLTDDGLASRSGLGHTD